MNSDLNSELLALDDAVINSESITELAMLGQLIDSTIDNLQVIRRTVDSRLSDMMDGKAKTEIPGFGVLERTRSSTWKPVDKATEVSLLVNVGIRARGKQRSPLIAAVDAAKFVGELASLSWRVTALRTQGIDPIDYLDVTHGDWRVKIPRA